VIKLSQRQAQVAELIKRGLKAREIAQALDISISTVKEHKRLLYGRLGLKGKAELLREGCKEENDE
jgi:DNA-binding NarL/FixJ family response regulator